jgi:probable F420-dependent oxidoreductase
MSATMQLSGVGILSVALRFGDPGEIHDAAAELEELGYSALWIAGGGGGDVLEAASRLLGATSHVAVGTCVLNIWMHDPDEVAAAHARLTSGGSHRFLLGLGISHAPMVEQAGLEYRRPLDTMRAYLDRLDGAVPAVPARERLLGALGPRMLELASTRTGGAVPYLVTPEHTAGARAALGNDQLLAPEQMVILDSDPVRARELARRTLAIYLQLPNYTNNLRRLGFGDDDLAPPGSDRLVDALVAWGDVDAIAGRVREHHDAGADHVCVQVLVDDFAIFPLRAWRELAAGLIPSPTS